MLKTFMLKIRKCETPLYENLYKILKNASEISFPPIPYIHLFLYYLYKNLRGIIHGVMERVWWTPIFRARLDKSGSGIRLHEGLPCIEGDNLIITVGNKVHFHNNTLSGGNVFENPVLMIGSGTHLGYGVGISVAKEISIGKNCRFSSFVYICDNDGHPLNPERRLEKLNKDEVETVIIGDNVWVGYGAIILKGSVILSNSVIAANTVISGMRIPPNSLAYGNPVKIKRIQDT